MVKYPDTSMSAMSSGSKPEDSRVRLFLPSKRK
jgi:hypothetical protein